jgi:6-phosphofructokinase
MHKQRIGILTGGGDVPALNAVLAASQRACEDKGAELVGFIRGWQGAIENHSVSLSALSIDPFIGGTVLKSSRVNLANSPGCLEKVRETLRTLDLLGLIVIGGEDTLSNSFHLKDIPHVMISKTIDNDVGVVESDSHEVRPENIINYFTLGFPTAAKKIASFVSLREGLRTTAYSHERLMIVESMGMHAGWLALSSAMGAPDFIIIPEFPVDYDVFKTRVIERYSQQKHLIIVMAEGARWANGRYVSANEDERDDFGHPRFKGSSEALAARLKKDLKREGFDVRNVNAVNPSYLYRSGSPGELDAHWARSLGTVAVETLLRGISEPLFLTVQRYDSTFSTGFYPLSSFDSIERLHRLVDERFYDAAGYSITPQGKEYLSPLVEEIPACGGYGLGRGKVPSADSEWCGARGERQSQIGD